MSQTPSITAEHCLAVHEAITSGEITEDNPISDALMAPFITAAEDFVSQGKEKIDAARSVKYAVYGTLRDEYREEAGDDLKKRQAAHKKAQSTEDAVVAGLKERGFTLQ